MICFADHRLTRHPRELEDLVDVLEASGAPVATAQSGQLIDLGSPSGQMRTVDSPRPAHDRRTRLVAASFGGTD